MIDVKDYNVVWFEDGNMPIDYFEQYVMARYNCFSPTDTNVALNHQGKRPANPPCSSFPVMRQQRINL